MTSSGCSRGRVHQLGPFTGGEAHPDSEQEPRRRVIKVSKENPVSPGVAEAALENGEKIFHPSDSIIRGNTHTIINYQKRLFF